MSRTYRHMVTAICACALALGGAAQAADCDGWINLFDGETLFGWTQFGDAEWEVEDGMLEASKGTGGWLASTCQFADFELSAKVSIKPGCSTGLVLRGGLEGHADENGSTVIYIADPEPKDTKRVKWEDVPCHEIAVKAVGGSIEATIDGKAVAGLTTGRTRGHIGIQYHHNNRAKVTIAELKLRPLNVKPIFNGETLDGWNTIPGRPSVFKVVDGAINITDGPGQIETAGVYKDFLLQLDIISNGDALNSGVFYRGPVGVFWKGYESQVRNQWVKDNREKPVDFGTGGNYGNQAARKVVSTDYEWFQKTIVCEGNHTSVWINGYLVSDYYDSRPISADANGKAGYVPGPGTIHLQGHDPTTNLSFKNINIQEYPAP